MYLSIITVALNNLDGLKKTLDSINSQNICHPEAIEWIVVDGGSFDGTYEFLRDLNVDFPFIYLSENDKGVFDAMNKGIGLSNNKYLLFLNSGDVFSSYDVLSEIFEYLTIGDHLIVAGFVNARYKSTFRKKDLNPWVCHQSVFVSRELMSKYSYDNELKYFGDLDLWKRLQKKGLWSVFRINTVVSTFELGGIGNKPQRIFDRLKERKLIDDRYGGKIPYIIRFAHSMLLYLTYRILGEDIYYKLILR